MVKPHAPVAAAPKEADRVRAPGIVGTRMGAHHRHAAQFDVQIFPGPVFVENNGRGGIAFGRCRVVSP